MKLYLIKVCAGLIGSAAHGKDERGDFWLL